jgi:hypothetical protein
VAKVADHVAYLAAFGEYCRAMKALNFNPVASTRGAHEELSQLYPQDNDDLALQFGMTRVYALMDETTVETQIDERRLARFRQMKIYDGSLNRCLKTHN